MTYAVLDSMKGEFKHTWLLCAEDKSEYPVKKGVKTQREMRKAGHCEEGGVYERLPMGFKLLLG